MFRKRILVSLVICLALSTAAFAADQPDYLKFTFLPTNDLHANLVPFNQADSLAGKIPQTQNVGGAARRATFVNRVRAEEPGIVLLLDSGDTTFGSNPIAKAYHGAPDVEVLNAMGYVAMEPGNHDFQWQSPDTLRNLKASRFPWICANLVEVKTGKTFLTPYIIKEYDGVRVAFFGLITQLVNSAPYKAREELGLNAIGGGPCILVTLRYHE
jgi:2',3'-cyclic-nucleotide 2'-phosphodiesterase (5'-nucleotidase family)